MIKPIIKVQSSIYLFLFILCLSQFSFGQEKENYSLLWKIEGKDKNSPSYLFGTMHIDDERAFNFSDAVMPAIESVKYFALEVNMDSMMVAYSKKKYDISASNYFKKLLKPKDYKRLLKRFEDVNEFSLEDSDIMDPDLVMSMIIPDFDKETDKSTFVDLYLLGHAKTMNKTIVGLENIEEQLNYFDNTSDKSKIRSVLDNLDIDIDSIARSKEIMTTIYETGDLNKIKDFVDQYDTIDANFISRNKVMCHSIIDYMKKGNIFAGVGAAHLVGKDNVIELLQNEGYTVTVVDAKFTGVADTYKIDPSKGPWYTYIDNDLGYFVELPKAPNIEEDLEDFIIYGYNDITTNTNYLFMAFDLGYTTSEDQNVTLSETMITNLLEERKGEVIGKEKLTDTDKFVYNITSQLPDNVIMKSRFIIKNNHFYYFSVESPKAQIEENYVNRFLNSIIIKDIVKKPKIVDWRPFESKKGAFSIQIPVEAKDISRDYPNPLNPEGEPYFINLYMATDTKNKNNYLIRYNDMPTGYYMLAKDVAFKETEKSLTQKAKLISEPKVIYLDGLEGREYEMLISDKYHSVARVYFRGNRTYLLIKQKLNETEKTITDDTFFNSFKFLPYQEENTLETYESTNGDFKMKLFGNVKEDIDTKGYSETYVEDSNDYFAVNPNSGGIYQYGYNNINKYFRMTTQKKFLNDYKNGVLEYNDSIVKEKFIVKDGDSLIEFYAKDKYNKNTNRVTYNRIWFNNERIQLTKANITDEEMNSGIVQRVFNSIDMKPVKSRFDIFESKAKYIIADLKSNDSTVYNNALSTFIYYEFDKDELSLLHDALNYDFSEEKNKEVKPKLINEFSIIDDEKSLDILERFYNKPTTSDNLKTTILLAIPAFTSDKALPLYTRLLFSNTPINNDSHNTLQPFKDSLNYGLENYDKLLKLMPHIKYRGDIIDLSISIYNSDLESKTTIIDNNDTVLEYFKVDLENYSKQTEAEREKDFTYNNLIYSYLKYLNTVKSKNESSKTVTLSIINGDFNKWMKLQAITANIINNNPISKDIIDTYSEDLYLRFEIMEAYHKQKRLSELNKNFLKPKEFAKLSFYNYAGEDYGYPDTLKVTKTITKNEEDFYVIKFSYNSENLEDSEVETNYIGIVGPIKKIDQNTDFKIFNALSYWEAYNDDWEQQAEKIISDLLDFKD